MEIRKLNGCLLFVSIINVFILDQVAMRNPFRMKPVYRKTMLVITALVMVGMFLPMVVFKTYAAPLTPSATAPSSFWLWHFLGRLHPLAVHFPVTLLLFIAFLEMISLSKFFNKLRPSINIMLLTAAIGAVIAVVFGLLLAGMEDYPPEVLWLHQWTGIGVAVLAMLATYLHFTILRKNRTGFILGYRLVLFFAAASVAVAGHYGSALTHGADWLNKVLPWTSEYKNKVNTNATLIALKTIDTAALTAAQQLQINGEIRGIFAHNCYSCHSAEKVKGDLRLDSKKFAFRGGKSGKDIIPGDPGKSELMRRLNLPRDHKEAMPSKGKALTADEISLISLWIEKGAVWPDAADQKMIFRVAKLEPRMPVLPLPKNGLTNPVDRWVNTYFEQKKINWPQKVDDRTYLRRIYLDIIGILPSPDDLEKFTKDIRSDKRSIWLRQLLDRKEDYAIHWMTFWNDMLRNDYTGTGYITGGRFNISNWLYKALLNNKSYDQFVKELINPNDSSKGFIKGIKWRGVVNSSQSTEMQAAQNTAQVFLGLNLKCASCHNSFISDWKLEDAYAFANIFSDTTLMINRCDVSTGKRAGTRMLWKELGTIDSSAKPGEKLAQLANNLIQPADGRLYRTLVNRIWAQLMGRGLVEPVDVMDNEPWNQDLLDWLAANFAANKFDLKELIFQIASSNTYMLPSVPIKEQHNLVAKDFEFSGMVRRRLSAEQFSDIVSTLLAPLFPDSLIQYDPFKSLALQRPTGYYARASLVANNSFLTALGRPNRETVATSRESRANLLQALELTNGNRFTAAIKTGAIAWKRKYRDNDIIIRELYKQALNRLPNQEELRTAMQVLNQSAGTAGVEDLFWAVLLLPEFQIIY